MTDAGQFVGRFHPLLVHFPIAFLVLAAVLELLVWRRRAAAWPAAAISPLLWIAAGAAVAAATAGYLLGTSGGYGGPAYERHLQLGVATAIGATVSAFAAWRRQRTNGTSLPLRTILIVTLVALAAAGHLGATLTHGEGYLTEYAPEPVRTLVARLSGRTIDPRYAGAAERAPVYTALVRPILQDRCASCHAGGAPKGGLRLDTREGILAGGDHGPVIVPERAIASPLVQRVFLPPEHPDAMPPRGQPPLPAADAAMLKWWVDTGASFESVLLDLEPTAEIMPVLEARLGPIARGGPTVPAVAPSPPDRGAIDAIAARGIDVSTVAEGSPFLQVRWSGRSDGTDDERVASLAPIAPNILWLAMPGTAITDAALATVGRMGNLTRLDISRTDVGDGGLQALASLAQLEYLNLYGTRVTDAGLARLSALPRLRRLYLWETAVTPEGVQRFKTAAPKIEVVVDSVAADAQP